MNDDALLEAVARVARDRGEDPLADPRWERLAAGTASTDDRAALEAMVAGGEVPEGAMDAFAPLSAEARDRFAAAALDALKPAAQATPAPVIDLAARRRQRVRWLGVGATALAAAAALVLVLKPPDGPGPVPGPHMPAYEVVFSGGDRILRSEDGVAVLRAGSRFELVLRPATAVSGDPPAASAFLVRDGERSPWDVRIQASAQGSFRITGTVGEELPAQPQELGIEVVLTPEAGDPVTLTHAVRIEAAP